VRLPAKQRRGKKKKRGKKLLPKGREKQNQLRAPRIPPNGKKGGGEGRKGTIKRDTKGILKRRCTQGEGKKKSWKKVDEIWQNEAGGNS